MRLFIQACRVMYMACRADCGQPRWMAFRNAVEWAWDRRRSGSGVSR